MKNNILYLESMGMTDKNGSELKHDLHNYRYYTVGYMPYKNCAKTLLEFTSADIYKTRYTNKRTGKKLVNPVRELVKSRALFVHSYNHLVRPGENFESCWGDSELLQEVYSMALDYTKDSILKIVNLYSPVKYNKVVVVEEAARDIINKLGGYREKNILATDPVFSIKGTTWTDDRKVVRVYSRVKNQLDDFCEVDILTNTITG